MTAPQSSLKIAVLISGNGSNLQAIIDAIKAQTLNANIVVVISDRADAFGLQRAAKANIPTEILPAKSFTDRSEYDLALQQLIESYHPGIIVLAGFMRILSPAFVEHFAGKIINIHPSLLPNYRGLNTHERVLTAQEKIHGVSIHFVTAELDGGPVIAQAQLEIDPNDTAETLKQRVHQLEHQLYPEVLRWFAQARLQFKANHVYLDGSLLGLRGKII